MAIAIETQLSLIDRTLVGDMKSYDYQQHTVAAGKFWIQRYLLVQSTMHF